MIQYKLNGNQIESILHLADTSLILGQRNSEWCAHGPILEQDIAITNITLDLIGQARNFYQYAATLINVSEGKKETEDTLAYLRTEREYKNLLICELPNGDWANTILRQFLFSAYQYLLFEELAQSNDQQLSAITKKAIKETSYHLKWSSEWVIRLGDGTEESHQRISSALDYLWSYTGEFFTPVHYESINTSLIKNNWLNIVTDVFTEATIPVPSPTFMQTGGKTGRHTEHLGFLLSNLQYLQRTYPEAEW